jgi:hypothetical protein
LRPNTEGANGGGGSSFQPHETSYDYNSPVAEAGEHGWHASIDKYTAMQNVLQKYSKTPLVAEPPLPSRTGYGSVTMTASAPVLANIGALTTKSNVSAVPQTMEAMECPSGFMHVVVVLSLEAVLAQGMMEEHARC